MFLDRLDSLLSFKVCIKLTIFVNGFLLMTHVFDDMYMFRTFKN